MPYLEDNKFQRTEERDFIDPKTGFGIRVVLGKGHSEFVDPKTKLKIGFVPEDVKARRPDGWTEGLELKSDPEAPRADIYAIVPQAMIKDIEEKGRQYVLNMPLADHKDGIVFMASDGRGGPLEKSQTNGNYSVLHSVIHNLGLMGYDAPPALLRTEVRNYIDAHLGRTAVRASQG